MSEQSPYDAVLREAADHLREATDTGWQRAQQAVMRSVLTTLKPSQPVRGHSEVAPYLISSAVVIGLLREYLDATRELRTMRVAVATDDEQDLAGITLVVSVTFPRSVTRTAQVARERALAALSAALGERAVAVPIEIDVIVADVHPEASL